MRVIDASLCRPVRLVAIASAALVLVGCNTTPNRAPVEDRMATPKAAVTAAAPTAAPTTPALAEPAKASPVADAGSRAGYYTVKPGDTLIRIGLDTGQNWKDLVRWNNLDNPNVIEVGQTLRVVAPGVDPGAATSRPVASTPAPPRPLDPRSGASAPAASGPVATTAATTTTPAPAPAPAPAGTAASREGDEDI